MTYQERIKLIKELTDEPLLCRLSLDLLQNEEHRPKPTQLIDLDIVKELIQLLEAKRRFEKSSLDQHIPLSYEVLVAGK